MINTVANLVQLLPLINRQFKIYDGQFFMVCFRCDKTDNQSSIFMIGDKRLCLFYNMKAMKNKLLLFTVSIILWQCTSSDSEPENFELKTKQIEDVALLNIEDSILVTGWYYITKEDTGIVRNLEGTSEYLNILPTPIVISTNFKRMNIQKEDEYNTYYLEIEFDEFGIEQWKKATEYAYQSSGKLGLIVENKLVCAPIVNYTITNGMGGGVSSKSKAEVKAIMKQIKSSKQKLKTFQKSNK